MRRLLIIVTAWMCFTSCGTDASTQDGHTLDIRIYHHFDAVEDCTVWLKEQASDFPGWQTEGYDFVQMTAGEARVEFQGVLPGTHYLMGLGFDGRDSVKGYQPVTVDARDPDHYQKVILYVSE